MRRAFVLTVSDGVSSGHREDASGAALEDRLRAHGWDVDRGVVPDDEKAISDAIRGAAAEHHLVISTGGTGLGPRDRTPQALAGVLDYVIDGFGEVMRSAGRQSTPLADLSRSLGGALGSTLVIAVPGSPRAALESLAAVEAIIDHAIDTLAGRTQQHPLRTDAAAAQVSENLVEHPRHHPDQHRE